MSLPEALMAALPLKPDPPLIVVGDHRQMPPIVKHDWEGETRRTFRQHQVYESLFDEIKKVAADREVVIGGDFNLTVSH